MSSNETQRVEKLQGDCEDWHNVGSTNDFGVTFENSWANQGGGVTPAGFFKDKMGTVHLRGLIDTGSTGTTCFTLPIGYRPDYDWIQVCVNNNGGPGPGGAAVYTTVNTDGAVVPSFSAGTNMRLDGVSFRAA